MPHDPFAASAAAVRSLIELAMAMTRASGATQEPQSTCVRGR
jgi:hypothetical protein